MPLLVGNAPCAAGNIKLANDCAVTIISAGAYAPPPGYSTVEPPPPQYVLPGFNASCLIEPPIPRPYSRWIKHDDIVVNKTAEQNFATCKTYVIENNIHHQHNKVVITTVNRRHLHTQRIITKENNFHHFNTDYVVKVNDIHTQRVEQLQAEGVTVNDYKQTQRIEPATCQVTAEGVPACGAAIAVAEPSCTTPAPASAISQQVIYESSPTLEQIAQRL